MDFEPFLASYKETNSITNKDTATYDDDYLNFVLNILGGKTFNNGLYRVFPVSQVDAATNAIATVFPEFRGRITAFGYDWLGRHFAVDNARYEGRQKLILMLEPGAGEAMEIPVPIIEFHNSELVEYGNEALSTSFYEEWKNREASPIQVDECIGYKKPLFLGGQDIVENLERIDFDVYIHLCGQLRNNAMKLPAGATIRDISIS